MLANLDRAASHVLPQNKKRVRYFAATAKKLRVISIYTNILTFLSQSDSDGQVAYDALERLRVVWRAYQMKRLKVNLESMQYHLKTAADVSLVLDGRVEHVCARPHSSLFATV